MFRRERASQDDCFRGEIQNLLNFPQIFLPEHRANPYPLYRTMMPAYWDELLQYNSSTPYSLRRAACDIELDGQQIRAPQRVLLSWASVNHDPDWFSDPDQLNLLRPTKRTLTFGLGPHACIGAVLVRLVMKCSLKLLMLLSHPLMVKSTTWKEGKRLRGLKTFRVVFHT